LRTEQQQKFIAFLKENQFLLRHFAKLNIVSYAGFYNAYCFSCWYEATGLTQEWRDAATQNIIIPMQGEIDSMNVSGCCSDITFEAKDNEDFKSTIF
jgi:TrmH family RNA methyltransferase